MARFTRWLLILILLVGFILFLLSGASKYLSFESLKQHHAILLFYTQTYYLKSVILFTLLYFLIVAFSIPGAVFLTLVGGLLFGPIAILYVVLGATAGAITLFLAVKTALGEWLAKKASGKIASMEEGLRKNAFSYLLFLRLLPIFPFWLINIGAGLLNVPLGVFALTTFLGIIPGAFVYVMVGHGMNTVIASHTTPNLGIMFEPAVILPLLVLACLSLTPIFYKMYRNRTHKLG